MASLDLISYSDCIRHLTAYSGGNTTSHGAEDLRVAIQESLRELAHSHKWTFLYRHFRLFLEASYSTGTVEYDHAGGTYERQLTLTGGVWPTNAIYFQVRINDVVCEIEDRKSSTVVTLHGNLNPGADIAAGAAFEAFRSGYTLPADFISLDNIRSESNWWFAQYVHPSEWLSLERYGQGAGTPQVYTIMRDPNLHGQMAMFLYPSPSSATTLDVIAQLRPRALRKTGFATAEYTGTISASASTVTGVGTSFDSTMVGSLLRTAENATAPTGVEGLNPWTHQKIVSAFTSATSLTSDSDFSAAVAAGSKFEVSDPVDVSPGLINLFYRLCEKNLAIRRNSKNKAEALALADEEWRLAASADRAVFQQQYAGQPRVRLGRFPEYTGDVVA